MRIDRRQATAGIAASLAGAASGVGGALAQLSYRGPNVVVIRFGGGVRRRETIEPETSWAPYLANKLIPRGALVRDLRIAQLDGVDTSHAEGAINVLCGRYRAYRDAGSSGLLRRLRPTAPTIFAYFRQAFAAPALRAVLINGEDRPQEEFLNYSAHGVGQDGGHAGVEYPLSSRSCPISPISRRSSSVASAFGCIF